jgi:multimeric flavodoxin WrbA
MATRFRHPRILILNTALSGDAGSTAVALARVRKILARAGQAEVRVGTLLGGKEKGVVKSFTDVRSELAWAEGFVFGTGTHWDSWSSVLQKFFEDATEAEGTKVWLGKPVACVVTEHSVGGKGVLSRLQGVLVTLGCLIPPMSGVVLSKVAQLAAGRSAVDGRGLAKDAKAKGVRGESVQGGEVAGMEDFWCAEDLKVVAHNLVEAVKGTRKWKAWRVDREDFSARWMR